MDIPKINWLTITGDISVEPLTARLPTTPMAYLYLIMGPTGAGKSSFIETFKGETQTLSISKNQLAGYTQHVTAYRLVNVMQQGEPVYLIDTPGFSDTKISEIKIVGMTKGWLRNNGIAEVNRILFLTPITETRLPRSRRRSIDMPYQLLGPLFDLSTVTFVTTMWDTLHNKRTRERAESNFSQLRDEVCKEFFKYYATSLTRFVNTRNSALEALDSHVHGVDAFYKPISAAMPQLYLDLHERTEGTLQQQQIIELDLAQPSAQTNTELKSILQRNLSDTNHTVTQSSSLSWFVLETLLPNTAMLLSVCV